MSFDPSTLSAQAKASYIAVGKHYSSHDTVAQANATLAALGKHGAALVDHGFSAADGDLLAVARDALISGEVTRTGQMGVMRQDRLAYGDALQEAKAQRESARAVLLAVMTVLRAAGAAEEVQRRVTTTLGQTSRVPKGRGEAMLLHAHLGLLLATFEVPDVAAAAASRGGPGVALGLGAAMTKLSAGLEQRPARRGPIEETEYLNLLDGIVVTLARQARRAARNAGRALGTPVVRQAFALRFLDGPPKRKGGVKPPRGAMEAMSGALAQEKVEDGRKSGEMAASTRREAEAAGVSAPVSRRETVSMETSSEPA
ncbi:hypothetical protein [Chondromyces crocatus]|uniref:Uncharacterized protein n=1 Tax=Chondromyces crocatus TaxID=52 RepID=A0A0K1ELT3_CHOCO|nr:hypothetical protein [Chondromyces crocatus]AKT41865.1 uncharacterized protein CMC5_060860 [Chondromyces crocatus]